MLTTPLLTCAEIRNTTKNLWLHLATQFPMTWQ